MIQMMPGQGMGAAGTGMGSSPAMPAQNSLSPQLMAMLMRMQSPQQGAPGMSPGAPGPMQAGSGGTPMASSIGMGGMPPGGMMPPPMMPQGQPPGMNGATLPGATPMPAGGGMSPGMMQLLMAMKGQQGGVPATMPGGSPNPQTNWLQQLLQGSAQPASPGTGTGAGGMT